MPKVRIGLIDSGVAAEQPVAAERGFALDQEGRVVACPMEADRLDHGARLAQIILKAAPEAALLNAQVFRTAHPIAPALIGAALEWLIEQRAQVINMSFGLRQDRAILRRHCAAAVSQGVLLVCAAPARGEPVFPAGYPGVLSVCGDNRCAPGEWSLLPDGPAYLGACPRPLPLHSQLHSERAQPAGASLAAAHLTAVLAAFFSEHPGASNKEALRYLEERCRFYGRERRHSDAALVTGARVI